MSFDAATYRALMHAGRTAEAAARLESFIIIESAHPLDLVDAHDVVCEFVTGNHNNSSALCHAGSGDRATPRTRALIIRHIDRFRRWFNPITDIRDDNADTEATRDALEEARVQTLLQRPGAYVDRGRGSVSSAVYGCATPIRSRSRTRTICCHCPSRCIAGCMTRTSWILRPYFLNSDPSI
jgi:hypothetical protein